MVSEISWVGGRPPCRQAFHENHEDRFMRCRLLVHAVPGHDVPGTSAVPAAPTGPAPPTGDFSMQWQTPQARDLRFGFEITMYVAAR
jgi:coenzyme PQQ precursor peptide PqqA